ncbi:MAG: hypothetical protein ACOX87_06380, partial [Chloroflexota bacterium]
AIQMGGQRGVAIAVGGVCGNTGKGPRLARLLVPFIPLEVPLEYGEIVLVVERIIDVWKVGARRGERLGDFTDRIGWPSFMREVGVPFDPYLIDNFTPASVRRNLQLRWTPGNVGRSEV